MPDEFNDLAPRYSHRRMKQEAERINDVAYAKAIDAVRTVPTLHNEGCFVRAESVIKAITKAFGR